MRRSNFFFYHAWLAACSFGLFCLVVSLTSCEVGWWGAFKNPKDSKNGGVTVLGLSLNKSSTTLLIGGASETLYATVFPTNASTKTVSWSSSNASVASVDSDGTVSGLSVGSAIITAKALDGGYTATCAVRVSGTYVAVSGVSLDRSSVTIGVNGSTTLVATVSPSGATTQSVSWASSDESIVSVSAVGKLTGKAEGTASITVTTTDGKLTASCTVTVSGVIIVASGVSLSKSSVTLLVGGTETLLATVSPSNASDKSVSWTSSSPSVATVDSAGSVTGVALGSTTITVTTADGHYSAWCTVTVSVPVAVSGVSLSATSVTMAYDDTYQLSATISPSNATNQNVTWTSSNPAAATVNSSGLVSGVAAGSTVITVTTVDGYYTATCTMTIDNSRFKYRASAGSHAWTSIAISKDGNFIAASSSDGVYTSSDRGVSWTVQSATTSLNLINLSMSSDGALMAAYDGDLMAPVVVNGYIYTSSDKGISWSKRASAGGRAWSDIAVSADGSFIAACVKGSYIFTSSDGGVDWTAQTTLGVLSWTSLAVSSDGSCLYAGTSSALYKSIDKGVSWSSLSGISFGAKVSTNNDGAIVYCCGTEYIISKSIDSGSSWEKTDIPYYYNMAPSCSSSGSIVFCFGSQTCSWDTGSTWKTLSRSMGSIGALSGDGTLAVYASGNYLYFWDMSSGGSTSASISSSSLADIGLAIVGSTVVGSESSSTFTARADSFFTVIGWYLDNALISGAAGTYSSPTDLAVGAHTLTVQVKANGLLYSASFRFKVQ
jgi:uncharacterized protein YjdB